MNKGQRVAIHPDLGTPVLESGYARTLAIAKVNYHCGVDAGQKYLITANEKGLIWFSVSGPATLMRNREWICPPNTTIAINIPLDKDRLYFSSPNANTKFYRRKVVE